MRFFSLRAICLAVLSSALAFSGFGQTRGIAAEGDSFRLSMGKIRSTMSAYRNLLEVIGNDPALASRFKAAKNALIKTNGQDTMALVAERLLPTEPKIANAFAKAGTNPRETATTMECLFGLMFGSAMIQQPKVNSNNLPAMVRENLAFFEANKTEILASFKQLEGAGERAGKLLNEEEEDDDDDNNEVASKTKLGK